MAHILAKMDIGNGFMDRFLIMVPSSLRPIPLEQIEAKIELQSSPIQDVDDIYRPLVDLDHNNPPKFYFSDAALRYVKKKHVKLDSHLARSAFFVVFSNPRKKLFRSTMRLQ